MNMRRVKSIGPNALAILATIMDARQEGRFMTIRSLARETGNNPPNVQGHLGRLQKAGLLQPVLGRHGALMPAVKFINLTTENDT